MSFDCHATKNEPRNAVNSAFLGSCTVTGQTFLSSFEAKFSSYKIRSMYYPFSAKFTPNSRCNFRSKRLLRSCKNLLSQCLQHVCKPHKNRIFLLFQTSLQTSPEQENDPDSLGFSRPSRSLIILILFHVFTWFFETLQTQSFAPKQDKDFCLEI